MSTTVQCRFCDGTGRVEVGRCIEIVKGRQCQHLARNDPEYFESQPDRAWVRPYCGMHGNMRLRARRAMNVPPAPAPLTTEDAS